MLYMGYFIIVNGQHILTCRGWKAASSCLCARQMLLNHLAKACPSIPHQCLLEGLGILGAPSHIYDFVANIYSHSTGSAGM